MLVFFNHLEYAPFKFSVGLLLYHLQNTVVK